MKKIAITILAVVLAVTYFKEGVAETLFMLALYTAIAVAAKILKYVFNRIDAVRKERMQNDLEWEQQKKQYAERVQLAQRERGQKCYLN